MVRMVMRYFVKNLKSKVAEVNEMTEVNND